MGEAAVPAEQSQAGEAAWLPSSDVDTSGTGNPVVAAPQRPPPPVYLIRPVHDRATFVLLRHSRVRARRGPVSVTWAPPGPDEATRVAYAVGRRVGSAVVRNRVRRRLRAAVGDEGSLLRPGAYLIGASVEAYQLGYDDLRASMGDALKAVAARAAVAAETSP